MFGKSSSSEKIITAPKPTKNGLEGQSKGGFTGFLNTRLGLPWSGVPTYNGEFAKVTTKKFYRQAVILFLIVLNFLWAICYWASYRLMNTVRQNDTVLEYGISHGDARPVGDIAMDGSLVLKNGEQYPAHSWTTIAAVSRYFHGPYYSVTQHVLAVPMDFTTVLHKVAPLLGLLLLTLVAYFIDRSWVRSNHPFETFAEVMQEYVPWYVRAGKALIGTLIVLTFALWVWVILPLPYR